MIPPGAWIFVCCECRVLSGRGLCDELITRPEESYRLCCVVVRDLETSRMGAPYIYDISRLRVKASQTEDVRNSQDAVFLEPVFTWGSVTFTFYCFPPRVLRWLYTWLALLPCVGETYEELTCTPAYWFPTFYISLSTCHFVENSWSHHSAYISFTKTHCKSLCTCRKWK